jgi:hypothetical protein
MCKDDELASEVHWNVITHCYRWSPWTFLFRFDAAYRVLAPIGWALPMPPAAKGFDSARAFLPPSRAWSTNLCCLTAQLLPWNPHVAVQGEVLRDPLAMNSTTLPAPLSPLEACFEPLRGTTSARPRSAQDLSVRSPMTWAIISQGYFLVTATLVKWARRRVRVTTLFPCHTVT